MAGAKIARIPTPMRKRSHRFIWALRGVSDSAPRRARAVAGPPYPSFGRVKRVLENILYRSPDLIPGLLVSERVRRWAFSQLGERVLTVPAVAADLGVGWLTVMEMVRQPGERLFEELSLDGVSVLGTGLPSLRPTPGSTELGRYLNHRARIIRRGSVESSMIEYGQSS